MKNKSGKKLLAEVYLRTASTKSLKKFLSSSESKENYFKEAILDFIHDGTVDQNLRLIITSILVEKGIGLKVNPTPKKRG